MRTQRLTCRAVAVRMDGKALAERIRQEMAREVDELGGLGGATPLGVMRLLAEYEIPVAGARAVVVGRSMIVGKPVALLLLQSNATVTICHSRTQDLQRHTLDAEILV